MSSARHWLRACVEPTCEGALDCAYALALRPVSEWADATRRNAFELYIAIDRKLKFDIDIDKIVVKARKLCGWIRRVFKTQNTLALLKLYINVVRPVLEYASVVWSPSKRTLIRKIEKVQRQFTKRIRSIKHLSYSDRLSALNIG